MILIVKNSFTSAEIKNTDPCPFSGSESASWHILPVHFYGQHGICNSISAFQQSNPVAVRIAEIHFFPSVLHRYRRFTVQSSGLKLGISLIQAAAGEHQVHNTCRMLAPFMLIPNDQPRQSAFKTDLRPVAVTEAFKRDGNPQNLGIERYKRRRVLRV
ncbi:hypothetical protein D3C75_1058030 [compost metagenome]